MESGENLLTAELHVDPIAFEHLHATAKWARFLAILGFIFSGLIALGGLFAASIFSSFRSITHSPAPMVGTGFITVIYLIIGCIYFFLSLYLYFFASKMITALAVTDQQIFNDSLMNLKRVYRIMGIIMIVYLGFIILAMIIGIMFAGSMR
ncbi:MAG: hypothetical protein ABI402_03815 [Ferruginibacter sp.]